mmetsp:Transcript_39063/g.107639  ORF Transcript_39063/g.107639 Transcript_39063/m.107639 type:complete len:215 (+) Transcript_39063:626-1270(+)
MVKARLSASGAIGSITTNRIGDPQQQQQGAMPSLPRCAGEQLGPRSTQALQHDSSAKRKAPSCIQGVFEQCLAALRSKRRRSSAWARSVITLVDCLGPSLGGFVGGELGKHGGDRRRSVSCKLLCGLGVFGIGRCNRRTGRGPYQFQQCSKRGTADLVCNAAVRHRGGKRRRQGGHHRARRVRPSHRVRPRRQRDCLQRRLAHHRRCGSARPRC